MLYHRIKGTKGCPVHYQIHYRFICAPVLPIRPQHSKKSRCPRASSIRQPNFLPQSSVFQSAFLKSWDSWKPCPPLSYPDCPAPGVYWVFFRMNSQFKMQQLGPKSGQLFTWADWAPQNTLNCIPESSATCRDCVEDVVCSSAERLMWE